jgi:hypothetical protein
MSKNKQLMRIPFKNKPNFCRLIWKSVIRKDVRYIFFNGYIRWNFQFEGQILNKMYVIMYLLFTIMYISIADYQRKRHRGSRIDFECCLFCSEVGRWQHVIMKSAAAVKSCALLIFCQDFNVFHLNGSSMIW